MFVIGYLPTDVLPASSEEFDEASGIKKLIEYKFNEDGKKVKVLLTWFSFVLLDKCWLFVHFELFCCSSCSSHFWILTNLGNPRDPCYFSCGFPVSVTVILFQFEFQLFFSVTITVI